jgi:IstB-like ATP binding protein
MQFAAATQWVARRLEATRQGSPRPGCAGSFIPLIVVDEAGYVPFDREGAILMFPAGLPPLRADVNYRHLDQAVLRLGEIFGDNTAATAMIDRRIHHAEIVSLKRDSYRLRGKDPHVRPTRSADLRR